MPIIDTLKDTSGNVVYPRTDITAVYDSTTGTRLDNMIADTITRANLDAGTLNALVNVDADLLGGLAPSAYIHTTGGIMTGQLLINSTEDASLVSTNHPFQIGPTSGGNIIIDQNEIMARSNGAVSALYLNNEGGAVYINGANIAWHAGNDGSGSGLDADLLDGLHSSSFLASGASFSYAGGIVRMQNDASSNMASTDALNGLQVFQTISGADASMSFHVSGDYAVHFGLDGATNQLSVGGWSMGGNKYRIFHAGLNTDSTGIANYSNLNDLPAYVKQLAVNPAALSNANYGRPYVSTTSDGANIMGLPVAGWYHIQYYRHLDDNGYGAQLAFPLNHTSSACWRRAEGSTWQSWRRIYDTGNITRSTADPSGGADGDIWIKYS